MNSVSKVFIIILITSAYLQGQSNNKQWVFGYDRDTLYKLGLNCLDFTNHEIRVYPYEYQNGISWITFSSSFICDTSGNIALISDNCSIYDKEFVTIEGGAQMHNNYWSVGYCLEDSHVYFPTKSNIVFPFIKSRLDYFQLYKDFYSTDEYVSSAFILNKIGMNKQSKLAVQSHDTIDDKKYQSITMINPTLNRNKDAWWLFNLGNNTNEYRAFLLNDEKLDTMHIQNIGRKLNERSQTINGAIFSPDNKLMVQLVNGIGLQIFDFDDQTGLFSNVREIKVEIDTFDRWAFGMCFSPNSRFLYVSTLADNSDPTYLNYLYQIDFQNSEVELIATFFQIDDTGWNVGIGSISRGPDCRLYVSPASTSHWMHVIHYPNEKGAACGFQPMAIDLPFRVGQVLPNFMQTRSDCDPTYEWPFPLATQTPGEEVYADISISPNPGKDIVFLNSEKIQPSLWKLDIYDMNGKLVKVVKGIDSYITQINIYDLSAAVYIYKVSDREGRLLKVGRLIKV